MRLAAAFPVVVEAACAYEIASLEGQRHNIPVLRWLPPISRICGRIWPVGAAVLFWLGVHFAQSRS